jgi:hypothetical protein
MKEARERKAKERREAAERDAPRWEAITAKLRRDAQEKAAKRTPRK